MFANDVFKAMADPTRREILRILGEGEMSAGELAKKFDMKKPSVSHHFSVLKGADLISSRREGQQIYYSLNTTVVQDLMTWMMEWMKVNETGANGAVSNGNGAENIELKNELFDTDDRGIASENSESEKERWS